MTRALLVLLVVALIGLSLWGMRRGWANRATRQAGVPEPAERPDDHGALGRPVPGLFMGTSTHGDWLDRIVIADLGTRSRCELSWGATGLWFDRVGARGLFIPTSDVVGVRLDQGVAATVRAKDSVIVVTWRLGDAAVDTGFRADDAHGHRLAIDGLTTTFATGVQQ